MNRSILKPVLRRSHSALLAGERKWPYLLALLSLLFLAITVVLDSKRPLSNDELFTFYISQQHSLHDVWNALLTGAEQLPIFFFIIVRMCTGVLGASPVSLRLPETLGFLLMNICTFLFVRRRVPVSYSFIAFIFPAVTDAYYYAVEARPYGLVMGFCGLAMLFWQSAAEGRERSLSLLGTGLFLACAVNSHYYAVLLLFPFGIAELVRYFETRKFDWPLYIAIAASVVPLIFSLPVIRASSNYSSHFWAKPNWTSLISFYERLLMPAALALMAIALISGLSIYLRRAESSERPMEQAPPAHDFGFAFGLILLPTVAVFLAKFVTGAFTSRYAIYTVIGLSILLAWSLARIGRNTRVLGLVLTGITVGFWLIIAVRDYRQFVSNQVDQDKTFEFLASCGNTGLPIVIADPHEFFVQSHVAAAEGRGHFTYLADVALALKYTDTDTVERGILALQRYAPLHVEDYRSFAASHPRFLVYGSPRDYVWVLQGLIDSGRRLSLKSRNGGTFLYVVGASGSSASPGWSSR